MRKRNLLIIIGMLCAANITLAQVSPQQPAQQTNPYLQNSQQMIDSANAQAKQQFEQTFPRPTAPQIPTSSTGQNMAGGPPGSSTTTPSTAAQNQNNTNANTNTQQQPQSPYGTTQQYPAQQNIAAPSYQTQQPTQNPQQPPTQPGNIFLPPSGSGSSGGSTSNNSSINIYH